MVQNKENIAIVPLLAAQGQPTNTFFASHSVASVLSV
ncbi:MAG: hypothetical protein ACI956_000515 [Nonlabens sp.]|jgi:hypothetical protein